MWISDQQKFGIGFLSGGLIFFALGLFLFFDRSCLAMGNILFLVGITLLLGARRTVSFFARKEKYRATAAFVLGVFMILMRWPVIGFVVEVYGILALFSEMFGVVVGFVGSVPVVGQYLEGPLRRITGASQQLPV